jgi:hypothetical protein
MRLIVTHQLSLARCDLLRLNDRQLKEFRRPLGGVAR